MYFPYLKLRQEESNAIKDTVCSYPDDKVLPILEPCHENDQELYSYKALNKTVQSLIEARKKFILIINSEADLASLKTVHANFDQYCIRGYYSNNPVITNYTGGHEIAVFHKTAGTPVQDAAYMKYHIMLPSVLGFGTYINSYPTNKVVKIEDAFEKHSPNSNYPASDLFKSTSVFTFRQNGYAGFGDYTILEAGYEVFGSARASRITHVIHLTRQRDQLQQLEVCHYLTTPTMEPDNKTRSIKTIEKAYNDRHRFLNTKGIQMIVAKYNHSTNAGYYKRVGMIHHIELMHSLI